VPGPAPTHVAGDGLSDLDGEREPFISSALAVDDNLNYSELSSTCNPSIFAAPWYWAQQDLSVYQPEFPVLAICTPGHSHWFTSPGTGRVDAPVGTPTPTPTASPASTYIIAVDIGWFSLTVTPISGAATVANGNWTFSALVNPVTFNDDHLYAFFVANWNSTSGEKH